MKTPLLHTKLSIPVIRSRLVIRARLLRRLDTGLQSKLTLVSAPAGFGKTTLVAAWVREAGLPTGWVSLDEQDNDPVLFFSYLFSAAQTAARVEETVSAGFESPQHPPVNVLLAGWLNEIAQQDSQLLLVLDDYHLIGNRSIHDALAYLLANSPPNLHLVLIARADPPLQLARLRGSGQLVEIREADLRFSQSEAVEFFQSFAGLALDQSHISALHRRTEGWIVGLQLAGLALHGRHDIQNFIETFTGGHHFIIDYLTEEVFNRQSEEIKEFLLKTCILERLSAPLCDAVTGRRDGNEMLHRLDQANLFAIPLDGERQWYRYHRLFSDLLHKRLMQESPGVAPDLHRRASVWYEQSGFTAPAIEHALFACDYERAVHLIEDNVEAALMRSEVTTFLNWMERLPDKLVRARPRLYFFHTWAMLIGGSPMSAVEQRLKDLAAAQDSLEEGEAMQGRMAALEAYLSLFRADIKRAARLSQEALQQLPHEDRFLRSIIAWILSHLGLVDKDPTVGSHTLNEIIQMAEAAGNPLIAVTTLCHQARLQMRQGKLHRAQEIYQQALLAAVDPGGRRLPIASEALCGLGDLEREWNNLEQAEIYLTESLDRYREWSELASFDAYFPIARLRMAQGDLEGARRAIETARQIAFSSDSTDLDDLLADLQQAYFFVMQGDAAAATRWAEKRGLLPIAALEVPPAAEESRDYIGEHLRKYEHLMLSRLLILQGQSGTALELLEALLDLARQLKRTDLIIEVQILTALAHQIERRTSQAVEALSEALRLAEPGGYMRIFLDEGEPLARLLQQAASQGIAPEYMAKLLPAYAYKKPLQDSASPSTSLLEPLSERELEVLRLLATGMSNPEIGQELVVAVSTVRSHCKSIYGKLGVHKRWDAVQRARELKII